MKKVYRLSILICCFLALGLTSRSQTFGNEWIDYSKTYYKLKIANEGIYRITRATLDAAGIANTVTGNMFVIYRDGQPIPLYVTTVGPLGANDYIEFYGKGPNGNLDKKLYQDPNWHANDSISLFSDTASYYLTFGTQNYPRWTVVGTPIPGTPPPAEQYVWFTSGKYFKNYCMPGTTYSASDHLFSSQFDKAEAWVDNESGLASPASLTLNTPNVFAGGPNAQVRINLAAMFQSAMQLPIRIYANSQQIKIDTLEMFPEPSVVEKWNIPVLPSLLQATNTISYTTPFAFTGFNLIGTAQAEIVYARNCDLGGQSSFKFMLKPNSSSQYLEFSNFNAGGQSPRLFDLTHNKIYTGDITTTPGVTRFYIDPSLIDRHLIVVAHNSNFINNITPSKTINFTNFSNNPGKYVIITHNKLRTASDGQDYVQKYKEYRSSSEGGGYSVVIADVEELYDQFAYGIDIHPLSIRNFLHHAYTNWSVKPEYALLLGRGLLYHKYKDYQQNQITYPFPIVPTYGDPGSDVDLGNFGTDLKAKIRIGRISAWNGLEIANYLNKVKLYEAALVPATQPAFESEKWKKSFIHIAGGSDLGLQATLLNTLNKGKTVIEKPYYGALVTTVAKNTTTPLDQTGSELVNAMIDSGVHWITFHGHASAGNFDFNLNNPEGYNNLPRLPHLMALGCDVSQIFNLTTLRTISERYINAQGGSISVIAQDNLGYTSFHEPYLQRFYGSISKNNYINTLGGHYNYAYDSTLLGYNIQDPTSFYFTEIESFILLGDPATKVYSIPKPDYHVSDGSITSTPGTVTTSLDSFQLNITAFNLGKASTDTSATVSDTVMVKIEHTNPQGVTDLVGVYPMVNLFNQKDLYVNIAIDKGFDIGLNKYRVTIDPENKYDENSETNNGGIFNLFIYSDRLIPIYPHEFAIVGQQGVTLKASTLNPFRPDANYKIEIDTTEKFNSPLRQQHNTTSIGGVIKWQPSMTYQDSVVYYWRTALDSGNNTTPIWTNTSFIYLPSKSGWNQSHYYQYKKDKFTALSLDSSNRRFDFAIMNNQLFCNNKVFYPGDQVNDIKIMMNDVDIQRSGCPPYVGTIQIMVLDPLTAQRWQNPAGGQGGSYGHCLGTRNSEIFEFGVNDYNGRNNAANFLGTIPDGHYVLIRNMIYDPAYVPSFVNDWMGDAGGNNNLYNRLKGMGFSLIDSFTQKRAFIFMCKKNDNSFPITQKITAGATDKIDADFVIPSRGNKGSLISKTVGPAKEWQELKWRASAHDNLLQNDSLYVKVIGLGANNVETELFNTMNLDTSLAGLSANMFPRLRLEWYSKDTATYTSAQLNYWRVHYVPVPEAALNPIAHFSFNDSLSVGQTAELQLGIEELAGLPMDSMLVKYKVIDANGVAHNLGSARYKKLNGNDTLHASVKFDPSSYPGANYLFIEANPDDDQVEQYHPNNLGYLPFRVFSDKLNPLIDVTFDGIHILDKDIVSAKPFIKILLKDENKFLMLDDTSDLDVFIRYVGPVDNPNQGTPAEKLVFDGTLTKFIPAANTEKNEAVVEYKPTFLNDGIYELAVNGEDQSGNKSGATDYKVQFEVINKSTITNVLNYPNPFSTSTAFCFTLTGSQIPSQFKIQVLSVTGKVVREITRAELGPLHVGRNITEYKWDGKDQYGQMLGNGVYLYRVVTAINGQDIEHRANEGIDKFNRKGYGKMYIMR